MDKRLAVWFAVVVIAIIAVVIFFGVRATPGSPVSPAAGGSPQAVVPGTPVAPNVQVPDEGAQDVAADIAVPQMQAPASHTGTAQYRSYTLNIQNGAYQPSTIIVNEGDVVSLEITAVDADYGFTLPAYGFNVAIPRGKTQRIGFEAVQQGQFTFYCSSCGGPGKGPTGSFMVK